VQHKISKQEFFQLLERVKAGSREARMIDAEIRENVSLALYGQTPRLEVEVEDPNLDREAYKQIVSKIYAGIRYEAY